jgi:hypothetical protein
LCGQTFRRGASYLSFSEPLAQVEADISIGYEYWRGVSAQNLDVGAEFFDSTGASFSTISSRDVSDWATRMDADTLAGTDYCDWADLAWWTSVIRKSEDLTVRRAERLNAWYPVWR